MNARKAAAALAAAVALAAPNIAYAGTAPAMYAPKRELRAQGLKAPTEYYTEENLMLLAKLIMAENGGAEHDETLYLTGAVVLNRARASGFPDTVKGVVYQRGQYSTASRLGSVEPDERCLEIADELLINGAPDVPDGLVFQSQFPQGRKIYKVIDGEYFCIAG